MTEAIILVGLLGLVSAAVLLLGLPFSLAEQVRAGCYASVVEIPRRRVGLVLGCARNLPSGRPNLYFRYRIEAATELVRAGKVEVLLVSGASDLADIDEAESMKEALVERGVPEASVVCDRHGYRTLDSVVRSQAVYALDEVTIISQAFHNRRALYIAKHRGIDAIAFDARDVSPPGGRKVRVREYCARLRVWADLYIFSARPRVEGPSTPL